MNASVEVTGDLGNDLIIFDQRISPAALFTPGAFDPIFERIKTTIKAEVVDPTTDEGRARLKQLAMKVTHTKTAIDAARKTLVADEKRRLKKIDDDGGVMWDKLEEFAKEVRKPADDFDALDKARIEGHKASIAQIAASSFFLVGAATTEEIERRLNAVKAIDPTTFEEFEADAAGARALAISQLEPMLAKAMQDDADRAELEKLRAAQAEQNQRDHDARVAAQAAQEANDRAWLSMYGEAEADNRAFDADRRAKKLAADEAAAAVVREQKRVADLAAAEQRESDRREADVAHRRTVNRAAVAAFVESGLMESHAKIAVEAIAKGLVPNVSITY